MEATAVRAPVLEMGDPLAEFLGALPPGGRFRYTYEDAVKLSGHSCPTVAGAYLMTVAALRELYGDVLPQRGEIEVVLGGLSGDGTTGPTAQVIMLLTGAAPETGFGGMMGRWRRKGLLTFDPALQGKVRFRRTDTGAVVEAVCRLDRVPPAPEMAALLAASLSGRASTEERLRFAGLWQSRVKELLSGDLSQVIEIRTLGRG